MPPQEFEPLAIWMGWRKGKGYANGYWFNTKGAVAGPVAAKTSLTDAEAVEALNRLVEKGYEAHLVYAYGSGWYLRILRDISTVVYLQPLSTIHEAVEAALIQLIAA